MSRFCEDCVNHICTILGRCQREVPAALNAMADKVLRYRPKPVSVAAKKRKKRAKKAAKGAG